MKTAALYLEDPYKKLCEATILDVQPDAPGVWRLILDQTVFYPMGGGQPTDQGTLQFADDITAEVNRVLLKDGEINHYVKMAREPHVGEVVTGTIDWERRYRHMKIHSAGHVIDFAMHLCGYSPALLKPMKGDHGKKPFIVYAGQLDKDIKQELQQKVEELISRGLQFSWSFQSLEELQKRAIYLQPGLPLHKPLRCLTLEGVGSVADGGTIVASTREVGTVQILSIDKVEGETHVKYQVS